MIGRSLASLLLLVGLSCALRPYSQVGRPQRPTAIQALQGMWQGIDDPGFFLEVEERQILIAYGGSVREAARILAAEDGRLHVCKEGRDALVEIQREEKGITFLDLGRGEVHSLRKLARRPAELSLSVALADPMPLDEQTVSTIRKEISRRQQEDVALQELGRKKPSARPPSPPSWLRPQTSGPARAERQMRWVEVTGKNAEYMRRILAEVGWIDVARFGYPTSKAAFLLVQHSWDVSLMRSVLPRLQEDVEAGRIEAEDYALLYDRLHLALGYPQRYGSQVLTEESGEVVVLPVEDPGRVEELREQLGLIPLKSYVRVFGAPEVRFSAACKESAAVATTSPARR